jgi:serpin B
MTHTMDDARLLAAWHDRNDAESFRLLCDRHTVLVEAACRRQGSPDVAEAAQAVFLVLARRAGSASGAHLGGWLTATAQRVVRNQHRAAASRHRHEQEAAVELSRQREAAATEPQWAEAQPHLDAALASLSAGRREAVLRFYLEGKSQAMVAAELGCSVDAVKTRVHEGLAGLRAFFARRGVALGATVLATGLASEATAGETGLSAICLQTVLNPASAPGAKALANQVLTAMIIKTSALIAAGVLLAASCLMVALMPGAEPVPPPPQPVADPSTSAPVAVKPSPVTAAERQELAAGNNRLALDLFARIRAKDQGNLFFSPFSIRAALAMTYAGARGATAAQMKQALHFSLPDARLHPAMGGAIADLNAGNKGCELAVANSLWGERSRAFLKPFLELNRISYGAGLEAVDFKTAAEATRRHINGWVEAKTQQRISDLIPVGGVSKDTRLVLVNAVYFKGAWAERFDKALTTQETWAYGAKRVPLMHRRARYGYAQQRMVDHPTRDSGPDNGEVQVLELPYAGDAVSMLVLLPSINTRLSDLENELTDAKLTAAVAALEPQEIEVGLPRFSATWGTKDLGPKDLGVLPALGMKDAFSYPQADFSGMDGSHELYIDAVFHKAFVNVQEEGTEAAAATAVAMKVGSPMPREAVVFRADRPFLFLIREKASGTILFLGRLTAP